MMDESKVKEIATANLQRLTDQLRLWEWRIDDQEPACVRCVESYRWRRESAYLN